MGFANEKPIKAIRKAHPCAGCGKMLNVGEPAIGWAGTTDGQFDTATYHPECREAEIALNKLQGNHWDEWSSLGDMEEDDHPWLFSTFPIVAERFGVTAETVLAMEAAEERRRRAWADAYRSRATPPIDAGEE